MKVEQL